MNRVMDSDAAFRDFISGYRDRLATADQAAEAAKGPVSLMTGRPERETPELLAMAERLYSIGSEFMAEIAALEGFATRLGVSLPGDTSSNSPDPTLTPNVTNRLAEAIAILERAELQLGSLRAALERMA